MAKGQMNGTEARYASSLALLHAAGEIEHWEYAPWKFRLGSNWKSTYTPDFLVVRTDYFELVEVKGHREDDAMAKFRIAARIYHWFAWTMVEEVGKNWRVILSF